MLDKILGLVISSIPVIVVLLILGWLMYKFPPPIVDFRRP